MDKQVLDFLKKERVCVLGTVAKDGFPQVSVMHYSLGENPLSFFFSTERTSHKYKNMLNNNKASCVVGLSEEEWVTVQMDGVIKELAEEELKEIKNIHYAKHPDSRQYEHDPNTVFLAFTPNWIRISDYNTSPATIRILKGSY
ncbi:pyridoxamine 5'-phosphate oxidase family protein [Candidatus Microgenomates bacterium]|nr:pyridoxamine 5'-phosphate oxidase family protein [Candidatus Microgenomates bacterium]